jgi:hypothetical protein
MKDADIQILRNARALIARGWCIGNQGLNCDGNYVEPWDTDAVRWCALGALNAQHGSYRFMRGQDDAMKALVMALPPQYRPDQFGIADYNNSHTQADVLALYDRAIVRLASKRTDAALVADLMARVMGERIPEEA